MSRFVFVALFVGLTSMASAAADSVGPSAQPERIIPGVDLNAARPDASIAPLDRLQVSVFREPELSIDDLLVDESGRILLPLVGSLPAAGKSKEALAGEITLRLRQYLRDPQVSVAIKQAAVRNITVAGSVMEPGVYPMAGRTTLLQAVALAKGPSQVASLNQTLIFRTVNGQRTAARFNLDAIARGKAADPEVLPGDTIAIASSHFKTAWRDIIASVRSFNIFSAIP